MKKGIYQESLRATNGSAAIHNQGCANGLPRAKALAMTKCHNQGVIANDSEAIHKKTAFTLAEVLITLMILGVIAMLVVPGMIQRADERATVVKVKKFYSQLQNAYNRSIIENGPMTDSWTRNMTYENIIKPYFRIAKTCLNDSCGYNTSSRWLDGKNGWTWSKNSLYSFILDDGSYLWITDPSEFYYITTPQKDTPHVWGKTFFKFKILGNRVTPNGSTDETNPDKIISHTSACKRTGQSAGDYCAAWVIEKGNMDYLHCDGLSWYGKQKCD